MGEWRIRVRTMYLATTLFSATGLIGGVLIGLGTLLAMVATGGRPGISGLISRTLGAQVGPQAWRVWFLVGMMAGAVMAVTVFRPAAAYEPTGSWGLVVLAGLLVGLGTRVGGGCTSGHGVCGLSLGCRSGLVATLVFMGTGFLTVWVVRHLLGGGGA